MKSFDTEGRELLNKNVTGAKGLDVSALSPGMHLIQTYNKAGEKTGVTRFVKQ